MRPAQPSVAHSWLHPASQRSYAATLVVSACPFLGYSSSAGEPLQVKVTDSFLSRLFLNQLSSPIPFMVQLSEHIPGEPALSAARAGCALAKGELRGAPSRAAPSAALAHPHNT